jgi:hypothetical protein
LTPKTTQHPVFFQTNSHLWRPILPMTWLSGNFKAPMGTLIDTGI